MRVLFVLLFLVGCSTSMTVEQLSLDSAEIHMLDLQQEECTTDGSHVCTYQKENTTIAVILEKYDSYDDLEGAFQYKSSHLIESEWYLSENKMGDMSKFLGWEDSGYYYYHLWIVDEPFLIHVTSKGSRDVNETILAIGENLLQR